MHLQFIGCGDAFGTGGRFNTCFHLVAHNVNALIDCGSSSLVGMNKLAIDRNAISTILITHFHADHIGGLPFFILEANYVLKRQSALTIAGPPGLKARYAEMMDAAYPGTQTLQLSFPLTLREVEIGKRNEIGNMRVTPFRVVHDERAGPCLGYRCETESKVVAYSGDTQWTDTIIDIGRNADLFICEAYTRDKPITSHMALSSLEKHLPQIKPKRLVLTHMSNDMLARRGEVPYESAEDGMIVQL
jgi:ribonuclease BN (tRNA processing enzyme)